MTGWKRVGSALERRRAIGMRERYTYVRRETPSWPQDLLREDVFRQSLGIDLAAAGAQIRKTLSAVET